MWAKALGLFGLAGVPDLTKKGKNPDEHRLGGRDNSPLFDDWFLAVDGGDLSAQARTCCTST